jgi:surface polysaccharide O-acyltransferase-like enzyme
MSEEKLIDTKENEKKENEINIENNDKKPTMNSIDENLEKDVNIALNKNDKKKRYFGIDLIRVVACFLVMLTHAGELYYIDSKGGLIKDKKNVWPGIFNSISRVCVPLFVIISGYLLLPMKTDYKTFFKKRMTRIVFPFIIFCILYDIYFLIKGDINYKNMLLNIPLIFINYGTQLGHLWFMYMIIGVYLFMPIITPWIEKAEKVHFYYYFSIWLISSTTYYIHIAFNEIWGEAYWNKNTMVSEFFGDFGYAVLGAFIKLHLKEKNLYILGLILYAVGTGFTMFGYLYSRETANTCEEIEVTWKFDSINVIIASCGIFLLLRKIECKNELVVKIFNDIALKSYGMYLAHIFFLQLYAYALDATNQFPLWCIFVVAILTFISSYLVIKGISYIPYSQFIIG